MDLLAKRGLKIDDEAEAAHYLKFIGYYRLSGYALPLSLKRTDGTHQFKPGVRFTDILNLYRFDRELRLILNDAIERVEVAFRTRVSDYMAVKYGPHWLLKADCFGVREEWSALLRRIAADVGFQEDGSVKEAKGKDVFIEHYYLKYTDPKLPPGQLDLIILVDVYHEFSQPQKMLQGIRAALKPGGRLVQLEYRKEDPSVPIRIDHKMSVNEAKTEVEFEGFKLSQVLETLPRQHILVFTKAAAAPAR